MTNVNLYLDTVNEIKKDLGIDKNGKVHSYLTNESAKRMDKFVPYDQGTLKSDITIKSNSVTYNQPYAEKWYYEHKGNGIRGNYWDKKMVSSEAEKLASDIQNYMERL